MTLVHHARRSCFKAAWTVALGWTLVGPITVVLSGCGGGADTATSDADKAQRAALANTTDAISNERSDASEKKATRKRARAYAIQGVTSIVATRDRNRMVVANAQGQIWTLNAAGKELSRFSAADESTRVGTKTVTATAGLVMSGNEKYLLTVNRNSTATAWRMDAGSKQFVLQGHEHGLRSVAASADGALIATGGEETRVMLWDGGSGKLKQVLRGATDFVNSVSVSADGRHVASGDASGLVLVWHAASGKLLHTLRGHVGEVNAVAFDGSGLRLASASEDGKVLLWDVSTGHGISALVGHRAEVRSVVFDASNALLAGGAVDGKLIVWDLASGRTVFSATPSALSTSAALDSSIASAVNAMAFSSAADSLLFAGLDDGTVVTMKLSTAGAKQ
jgi:WD40 repeat protein